MVRRAFSEEFKEEAIRLVVEQGYPFSKACGRLELGRQPCVAGSRSGGRRIAWMCPVLHNSVQTRAGSRS
ncbi:transposase domain protein [Burkholderia pseudomallei MSHR449]|nr:transposase domain protein [Burkholderia pseudomallei MSHR449]KGX05151.1 putative transposase [Burkholderia pseudomallei MSHR640]